MAEYAEETLNYFRLISLVVRQGNAAVRALLVQSRRKHGKDSLVDWLEDKRDRIAADVKKNDAKKAGAKKGTSQRYQPLYQQQFDILFPIPPATAPTEESLDMTLLCYLLTNFCAKVCSNEEKEAAKTLRELRNPLMHKTVDSVDDYEFEQLWSRGSEAVEVLLPSAKEELERRKYGPLVEGAEEDVTYLKLQYEEEEKQGLLRMQMWERKLSQQTHKTENLDRRVRRLEEEHSRGKDKSEAGNDNCDTNSTTTTPTTPTTQTSLP